MFEISIVGVQDWALQGRVNDDQSVPSPLNVTSFIKAVVWEFLGLADVTHLSKEVHTRQFGGVSNVQRLSKVYETYADPF